MENTLVVFDSKNCWMVDFKHTPEAAKMQRLFGTTAILLPFTLLAPVSDVMADVKRHNPQYAVVADAANGLR